ncbi:hypothetical protein COW94_01770 [Candidatus Peregrinibacteria bacterium CG22_combo_CG10-13_8_21_14_all_44_10]|nr:MAG: hypothetical protein AUK45_03450 [Candidatus Peregrinibacteria bacterium CG2_30_44_17]PIP66445.1 MAG: hypothetical protein COW94_01770 [Candidatus Peregrinibacteria bacterium CG22_combo_CG10-13_8_21_14_all_44_10]PIS03710.1 MAG: hypothetical protein COT83_04600 [Candidatus Peregrinibacteria bacterium CG10_big_fil_rev_8_21_14_0_10_44_7]
MKKNSKNPGLIRALIVETLRGKTLVRTLMNLSLQRYAKNNPLSGEVIDLGSKSDTMSYNRFISRDENCNITYTDLYPESDNVKKIDLEKPFEVEDNHYDMALCFNVMEHIYNYQNLVKESHRILKKGGVFIGHTPLLIAYHQDPEDYFRYTHTALKRMFEEVGFKMKKMDPLGIGPFSTGLYPVVMLGPQFLRPILLLSTILTDKLLNLMTGNRHTGREHTLSYMFVFEKE